MSQSSSNLFNEENLTFCEKYESTLKSANLLESLGDNLTFKGKEQLQKIREWLHKHADRYFQLMN